MSWIYESYFLKPKSYSCCWTVYRATWIHQHLNKKTREIVIIKLILKKKIKKLSPISPNQKTKKKRLTSSNDYFLILHDSFISVSPFLRQLDLMVHHLWLLQLHVVTLLMMRITIMIIIIVIVTPNP